MGWFRNRPSKEQIYRYLTLETDLDGIVSKMMELFISLQPEMVCRRSAEIGRNKHTLQPYPWISILKLAIRLAICLAQATFYTINTLSLTNRLPLTTFWSCGCGCCCFLWPVVYPPNRPPMARVYCSRGPIGLWRKAGFQSGDGFDVWFWAAGRDSNIQIESMGLE